MNTLSHKQDMIAPQLPLLEQNYDEHWSMRLMTVAGLLTVVGIVLALSA